MRSCGEPAKFPQPSCCEPALNGNTQGCAKLAPASHACAKGKTGTMTGPVRWGIPSTANINAKVLKGAALSQDVSMVAVGSRDGERSRAYATQMGHRARVRQLRGGTR